ncbi:NUDIX domain-containing protein [Aliamphritea spongicola]|nr:NUDIX domain-containing protein [Aliamphritea spongicola]
MSTALLPDLSAACDCVVFLLVRDGQMLLEKRAMHKTSGPGLHSIPGGHVESGESCEQALLREMQEELGVQPLRWQHFCTLYYQTAELQRNHYYLVDDWQGIFSASRRSLCTGLAWMKLNGWMCRRTEWPCKPAGN